MHDTPEPLFDLNEIKNASELGQLLRAVRKKQGQTLQKAANLGNISPRFLSELERGKETAELGKALHTIQLLGLEVIIQPRGTLARIKQLIRRDTATRKLADD